jgi:DNA-directed RNA polymerase specialized sigma subunit
VHKKQYKNYINQNEAFDIDDLISEGNIGLIKSIQSLTQN